MRLVPLLAFVVCACGPDELQSSSTGSPPAIFTVTPVAHARGAELTGGGLAITEQGTLAAVSDADYDRVWLVDLKGAAVRGQVMLPKGSRPGRIAVDAAGDLYVALRELGQVAKISPSSKAVVLTRDVCDDPRGLTWDAQAQVVRVACASGVVAELPPLGPAVTTRSVSDVRDIVITPAGITTTTFRSAQVLRRGENPYAIANVQTSTGGLVFGAHVAWRTIAAPDGTIVMAHQREVLGPVEGLAGTNAQANAPTYGGGPPSCEMPVVRSALTLMSADGAVRSTELSGALPVDVAVSPDGKTAAVALAGRSGIELVPLTLPFGPPSVCASGGGVLVPLEGVPDAVQYLADGTLVAHTLRPNKLVVITGENVTRVLSLDQRPSMDPGRDFFEATVNRLACASCHPEGRDDGHTWVVAGKQRRTPSLAAGLLATAPFHWEGEFEDIGGVVDDTFVKRMGGLKPDDTAINELANFIDSIPHPAPAIGRSPHELKMIALGQAVFEGAGCDQCHAGEAFTTTASRDVGTGGQFQVPSLRGVSARGPWLHDGRAGTLKQRFSASGGSGDKHGRTSTLTDGEVDQLVMYLESL